jgi:hypothetical protein
MRLKRFAANLIQIGCISRREAAETWRFALDLMNLTERKTP